MKLLIQSRISQLIALFSSFLTSFLIVIIYSLFFVQANQSIVLKSENSPPEITADLKNMSSLGILLLGTGGAGHPGGHLTDAIQVVFLDFQKHVVLLISIPRDLWVKTNPGGETKINTIFSQNPNAMKTLVSQITGVKIDYFISVDFVGFTRTVGLALKGIDVEVAQNLDDQWYPISGEELNTCGKSAQEVAEITVNFKGSALEQQFPCRYERLHFEKGLVHMEGADALKYVRSRHGSAQGDISRGIRQQEILKAVRKKMLSLDTLSSLPDMFLKLTEYVNTDINGAIIQQLSPLLTGAAEYKLININLSFDNVLASSQSSDGQSIVIPKEGINKWDKIKQYVQDKINSK